MAELFFLGHLTSCQKGVWQGIDVMTLHVCESHANVRDSSYRHLSDDAIHAIAKRNRNISLDLHNGFIEAR
jgi:microsomal dipeptidase-like Zn-dependent dipeptidase